MQLGLVGLGRMGANMVRRLQNNGHKCTVFDLNTDNVKKLVAEGAAGASSLEDLVHKLPKPRAVWVMVPSGKPTESTVQALANAMEPGDTIIDGGNSFYKDDIRRAAELKNRGIHYMDAGTSGGVWGVERGYCLMIGADPEPFKQLEPIFKTLAPGLGDISRRS
jgi:6-phosphogluconate dehydrogenase